ncbi:MAG: TolC family protein [Bacteroidales bacterium]|nr:TolC family protein [Bacteroidales bacterium]
MKALLLALALTAVQQPADSIPDLSHPWSLQECMDWALEHNLSVVSQELSLQSKDIDRNTAEMSWLPSVNASASENISFGRGLGGNNTYEYGNSATTGISLGGSMTLFDGLATPNRIKLARLDLDAATESLEKVRDDIRTAVAKAYVQILYNLEIQDVALQQVAIDSLQAERLEGMLSVGRSSKADVSQQKASLAQSRVTLVQAQNNVRAAVLDLAQLLELPSWDGFSVVRFDAPAPGDVYLGHPDDIYADAVMTRPSIKAEELKLKGTEYSLNIAKSGYYPSLSLSAGLGTNYYSSFADVGFWDQLRANFSQYVGLSLNIPIFNKFQVRNQVRTARVQQDLQKAQLRSAQQTLYKEIYQAWNGAVAAQAKYEASVEAESAAQDAFELTQAKYEGGGATFTDFSEARTRYMKARSDLVQASCEYLFQTALVQFYRSGTLTL